MKLRLICLMSVFNLAFLNSYTQSDRGHICEEEKGYVERKSLITSNLDCSNNDIDGLCSVIISSPKKVENRQFMVFTFLRRVDGKVETYLNMQSRFYDNLVRTGFEFAESSASSVTVHAVYENINGCTLRSSLNLGDLLSEQRDQISKDKMEKLPAQ